ncbi:hypothetical protein DFH06DRAFT_174935 [Mycena polygramma]|nr:hypothetical protein DFH06DRAFT_174935 [Mycena polygramma]
MASVRLRALAGASLLIVPNSSGISFHVESSGNTGSSCGATGCPAAGRCITVLNILFYRCTRDCFNFRPRRNPCFSRAKFSLPEWRKQCSQ